MIKKMAVIGAGTRGHGIAETFALHGYPVNIFETSEKIRETVMDIMRQELEFMCENELITSQAVEDALKNMKIYDNMKEATIEADYIIEAAPEILELKQSMFKELDGYCKPEAIFASNTSSQIGRAHV